MYSDNNGIFGGGMWGFIAIIILLFLLAPNGYGNRGGNADAMAYHAVANTVPAIDIIKGQQEIEKGICQSGYATQALANGVQRDILTGNNVLGQQIAGVAQLMQNNAAALQSSLDRCCCELGKGQMRIENALERYSCNILEAVRNEGSKTREHMNEIETRKLRQELDFAQDTISNDRQARYILGQLGKYHPYGGDCCNSCNPCCKA